MTWTITIKTMQTMAATAMVMTRKMSLDDRLGLELETRHVTWGMKKQRIDLET
jgi:hypothetical protein